MAVKNTSPVDVPHLAKLSALNVSPDQVNVLASQFIATLVVVKKLEELDTVKVIPTSQVTGQTNRFREDAIDSLRLLSQRAALSNAKHTYHGYFVVPAIL